MIEKKFFELAIHNVTKFGDTDIFPFPIENHIFFDEIEKTTALLTVIDEKFNEYIIQYPPLNINTCVPVGYTGFRWATQIDPIWNLYFLSLVLSISDVIEKYRIDKDHVFSYRILPNFSDGSIFDYDYNWNQFIRKSLEYCTRENVNYIISCDIADFYNRIYHHRLENALNFSGVDKNYVKRIMLILQKFSGSVSYGLPIGGPAARILAEVALDSTDKILRMQGIKFHRFVDDYHIFCSSLEKAHKALNFLSIKLLKNEGLSLQKTKTKIMTVSEFKKLLNSRLDLEDDSETNKQRYRFSSLHINYDPYSPTADEDYEYLKKELSKFDIIGLLNDELRKSRINQHFSKRLLKSFIALDNKTLSIAFQSIINSIDSFYPIFNSLMISFYKNKHKIEQSVRKKIDEKLRELVLNDSYIVQTELNSAYLIKVLALDKCSENEEAIIKVYEKFNDSILIKYITLHIFTKWKLHYWLSDLKSKFNTMTNWERRLFIISSYFLDDEGRHWREHNKKYFNDFDKLVREWISKKISIPSWELPL